MTTPTFGIELQLPHSAGDLQCQTLVLVEQKYEICHESFWSGHIETYPKWAGLVQRE
jgi:hypothetical protein